MNLKELRIKKGLTQKELSELTTIDCATLSLYENGKRQPSLHKTILLASALNVSTGDIVNCILGDTTDEF